MAKSQQSLQSRGVSIQKEYSWGQEGLISSSSLDNMARFQQKQLREKEQRLLQLCDQRQKRAYQVARKGSAGPDQQNLKAPAMNRKTYNRTTTVTRETSTKSHGGKVRQMFDERRQTSVKGIDRSHPLEPLDNKPNYGKRITNSTTPSHVTSNGSSTTTRQTVTVKRVTHADHNSNVKGGELLSSPTDSVTLHYSRAISGSGDANLTLDQNHRNGNAIEVHDEDALQKNRTLGKIHLMDYDKSLKHRVTNDLDNERFPEDPKKIQRGTSDKVHVTKASANKPSAAEVRLERFRTVNARRNSVNAKEAAARKQSEESQSVSFRNAKSSSPDQTSPRGSSTSKVSENKTKETKNIARTTIRKNKPQQEKPKEVNDDTGTKETGTTQDPIFRDSSDERRNASKELAKNAANISTGSANQAELVANNKDQSRPPSSLSSHGSLERNQASPAPKRSMASKAKPQSATASPRRANAALKNNAAESGDALVSCKICGRRFAQERVARHEQICSKTVQKKRKQFDSATARVKGTELEPFVQKGTKKSHASEAKIKKAPGKSNWRVKHEDFINSIRSAKQVQAHLAAGGKLSDLPPPPPSDTSDYVQCPHCGRKFNVGAAERHIPKCEQMQHNKPNPRAPQKKKR